MTVLQITGFVLVVATLCYVHNRYIRYRISQEIKKVKKLIEDIGKYNNNTETTDKEKE